MKFIECLNSGKKFRHKSWRDSTLYVYVTDGIIYNNFNTAVLTISNIDSENWELFPSVEIGSLLHGTTIIYHREICTKVDVLSICGTTLYGIQNKENKVQLVNPTLLVEVYDGSL